MTPYKMQNLVYEWVDFSKVLQIWAKIGSNLRKFWKNWVILFKIWPNIGPIGIWMGHFFLKNWYLYGSTFKFHGGTSLLKPNLSTPRGNCHRLNLTSVQTTKRNIGLMANRPLSLKCIGANNIFSLKYVYGTPNQKHSKLVKMVNEKND